uniref:Exostosin GT47 domain-containing protein n=1 Tax=Tetradesmus obliquus TaxID=3088 RepID=A0A383VC23_TETOB|eukprot:jgi/Sobl393_1/6569/SZX62302.1
MVQPPESGGVLQELSRLVEAGKLGDNVLISNSSSSSDILQAMCGSKFCLAASGDCWSSSLSQAVAAGCVPVIVQDGVHQPFEDQLPYNAFSVRLPRARLPHIVQLLSAIPEEQYIKLRQGLAQNWRAFVWLPKFGGQAYNYTIKSLRRRATDLQAGLY